MRAALACLVLLACATPPARSPPPETPTILAWSARGGEPVTYRIRDGRIVAKLPGIRVATTRGEWRWTARRIDVPTSACEEPVRAAAGIGHLVRAAFERDGEAQVVVEPDRAAAATANELDDDVRLVGTVGTLAFLERRTYAYACGAHGAEEHAFVVWDVDAGAPVDLLAHIPDPATVIARAGLPAPEGDPARITELLPFFSGGEVRFLAQVTAPACFACGDGLWSSYTRSVRIPAAAPPGVEKRLPVPLVELAPRLEIQGWSVVPERMRPSVLTEP